MLVPERVLAVRAQDMIRCLPGGVDGLLEVTNQLHAAGVRVLWPYNPWDQGTRPQGMSDAQSMAQLLKRCVPLPAACCLFHSPCPSLLWLPDLLCLGLMVWDHRAMRTLVTMSVLFAAQHQW